MPIPTKIVNLSELAATRAQMTPNVLDTLCSDMLEDHPCLAGIVATHNAADVLIEAVRAAKMWASPDLGPGESAQAWAALTAALAKVSL